MKRNPEKKNFLLNLVIILVVVIGAYSYFKPPTFQSLVAKWKDDEVNVKVFESLTSQLLNEAIIYETAEGPAKTKAKTDLLSTAVQRKEYTVTMMKKNPQEFLNNVISSDLKADMLSDVIGIEQAAKIEGEIEIVCAIDNDGTVLTQDVFVTNQKGEVYQLYLVDSEVLDGVQSGSKIKATGYELDGHFVPDTLSNTDNFEIVAAALQPNAANHKVGVIMTYFEGEAIPTRTKAQVMTAMEYNKGYMEEVSFGQLTMSGKNHNVADIYGYYAIPKGNTACNYSTWGNAAIQAAGKDGFTTSGYRHYMILLPPNHGCSWAGLASLGGNYSYYANTISSMVIEHELGHNLGFHHARSATCTEGSTKVQVSNNCTYSEYGDQFDTMGNYYPRHYSALRKYNYGWIPSSNVTKISKDGVYELYPLEYATTKPQLLHISFGSGDVNNYYLDFRTPSPYDPYTPGSSPVRGVMVRTSAGSKGSLTNLYNANPASAFSSAALGVGGTFIDSAKKVTFKVISADDTKAVVEVLFNSTGTPGTCTRNNPTYTVTPTTSSSAAGGAITYTISVKNNDTSGCAASTFDITSSIPTGFTQNKATASLTIAAGITTTTTFTITSNTTATAGNYPLSFTIKNATSGAQQILSATYTVTGTATPTCTRSNPTLAFTPTSAVGKPGDILSYTLSIKNNDTTACAASTYTIGAAMPSGFTIDNSNISTSIAAGATYTQIFKVTSGLSVANGNYTIPFTVKNTTLNTTSPVVNITYTVSAPATCTRGEPTVSFSPVSQSGTPGAALTYTLSIKNNDSTACASSNYSIAGTLPNGLRIDANNFSTSVSPGVTYTRKVIITSEATMQNGNYIVPFTITNTTLGTTKSTSLTYTISGAVTCKKVAPTISISPTSGTGEQGATISYTMTVKNNDSGCANNTYNVVASVPSGFTLDISKASMTLASGKSASQAFKMTSGVNTLNGIYALSLAVTEGTNSYKASANYNVITYVAVPPSVNVTGLTNNQKIGSGNTNVTASASHSKGIATINIYLNGAKVATCNNPNKGECKYGVNANKIVSGTYMLKVEAIANDSTKTSNSKTVTFIR